MAGTEAALAGSALLILLVLALRTPVRRWIGPRLGYWLWALPASRLILPPLPLHLLGAVPLTRPAVSSMPMLFSGPRGTAATWHGIDAASISVALLGLWLTGAVLCFAFHVIRHCRFCARIRATSTPYGDIGKLRIVAASIEAPLAFGVFERVIVVPESFALDYDATERDLALAHEAAHHTRGDLLANWASLIMLAAHWWNPVAWVAIRAFRDDQEFAADAQVLAARQPSARPVYAQVLAKAAGIGALPACNLNALSNLKGRLMMLTQTPRSTRRLVAGGAALALLGGAALAATATTSAPGPATGKQAVTIGIKPDGSGSYALILGRTAVAAGAPLPGGVTLPADFTGPKDCDLKPAAKPFAMVIKGMGATRTYTVMCASAAPAPVRATLSEGLTSLTTMRASVASQPASAVFPETERTHALGAIDRSIREVKASLAVRV